MYANPSQGGVFAFYGVPDGEYDLTAERLEGDRSDKLGSEPRRVTVRGADVTGVELRLSPRAAIEGKVVLDPLPQRCDEKRQLAPEEIILQARRDGAVRRRCRASFFFPRYDGERKGRISAQESRSSALPASSEPAGRELVPEVNNRARIRSRERRRYCAQRHSSQSGRAAEWGHSDRRRRRGRP